MADEKVINIGEHAGVDASLFRQIAVEVRQEILVVEGFDFYWPGIPKEVADKCRLQIDLVKPAEGHKHRIRISFLPREVTRGD